MTSLETGRPVAPTPSATALTVTGLSFAYPGPAPGVLRDVSFGVRPGESMGILGANGSGKSTLLNALLEVRPGRRTGRVVIGGAERFRRDLVGYATQQVALYQQLTVMENLRHMAGLVLPRRATGAAAERALDEFGLAGRAGTPVHRLSGGWQRLAHLATSFVHAPPVKLLDEPTTALDFETRTRLVELVGRWRRAGSTVLVTSHYPEDIEEMCTHAIVIRDGSVARSGRTAELLSGYRREVVVDTVAAGEPRRLRAPAPDRAADLGPVVERMVAGADGELIAVRTTGSRLRDVLTADPQLRGVLDEPS